MSHKEKSTGIVEIVAPSGISNLRDSSKVRRSPSTIVKDTGFARLKASPVAVLVTVKGS